MKEEDFKIYSGGYFTDTLMMIAVGTSVMISGALLVMMRGSGALH
jgi:hypothetical protein